MRPVVTGALALVLLALAACDAAPSAPKRAPLAATTASPTPASRGSRAARMFSGTESAPGVLATECRGDECVRRAPAKPRRYLEAAGGGLLFFAMGARPPRAQVLVRERGGRVAARRSYRPRAASFAFLPSRPLAGGRYLVVLIARWPEREYRWVFGLEVGA